MPTQGGVPVTRTTMAGRLLALLLVFVFVAAACSSDSDEGAGSDTTGESAASLCDGFPPTASGDTTTTAASGDTTTTAAPDETTTTTAAAKSSQADDTTTTEASTDTTDTTAADDTSDVPTQAGGDFIDLGTFVGDPPEHIDPALNATLDAYQVINALYDGLTEIDSSDPANPQTVPLVAESVEPNEDATVWTFKIRDGQTFSNGEPILPSSFQLA